MEPVDVDLQEMMINQLSRLGRHSEARQQYESCRIALRRQLDMEPPERMRALEQLFH